MAGAVWRMGADPEREAGCVGETIVELVLDLAAQGAAVVKVFFKKRI